MYIYTDKYVCVYTLNEFTHLADAVARVVVDDAGIFVMFVIHVCVYSYIYGVRDMSSRELMSRTLYSCVCILIYL